MKLVTRETLAKQLFRKLKMNIYLSVLPGAATWKETSCRGSRTTMEEMKLWRSSGGGVRTIANVSASIGYDWLDVERCSYDWWTISVLRVGLWLEHCSLSHYTESYPTQPCILLFGWSWIIDWNCRFIDKYNECLSSCLVGMLLPCACVIDRGIAIYSDARVQESSVMLDVQSEDVAHESGNDKLYWHLVMNINGVVRMIARTDLSRTGLSTLGRYVKH